MHQPWHGGRALSRNERELGGDRHGFADAHTHIATLVNEVWTYHSHLCTCKALGQVPALSCL